MCLRTEGGELLLDTSRTAWGKNRDIILFSQVKCKRLRSKMCTRGTRKDAFIASRAVDIDVVSASVSASPSLPPSLSLSCARCSSKFLHTSLCMTGNCLYRDTPVKALKRQSGNASSLSRSLPPPSPPCGFVSLLSVTLSPQSSAHTFCIQNYKWTQTVSHRIPVVCTNASFFSCT